MFVLPQDLQHRLGDDFPPVLRWANRKYQILARKHRRDLSVIEHLSLYLAGWKYVGTESGSDRRRVMFQDETGRWYAATVGVDETGSYNVVTVFGGSDRGFLTNRLRGMGNIVRNEE